MQLDDALAPSYPLDVSVAVSDQGMLPRPAATEAVVQEALWRLRSDPWLVPSSDDLSLWPPTGVLWVFAGPLFISAPLLPLLEAPFHVLLFGSSDSPCHLQFQIVVSIGFALPV